MRAAYTRAGPNRPLEERGHRAHSSARRAFRAAGVACAAGRVPLGVFLALFGCLAAGADPPIAYLIPGQGADGRLFANLKIEGYRTEVLELPVPEKRERMPQYAARIAEGIDTTGEFALVGVSLGGMVAVEIAKIASPVAVVVISSAKTRSELPPRYRILKWLPLHRIFGGRFYKATGQVARPIFEPDSREDDEVFAEMLRDKDPRFMRRSIDCIVTWENGTVPPGVVHIHGDRDHTIPARNVRDAIIVEGGSHVMVFTRGAEISALVNRCLAR